jgi:hypothetical protein
MKRFLMLAVAGLMALGFSQAAAHASAYTLNNIESMNGASKLKTISPSTGPDTFSFTLHQTSNLVGGIADQQLGSLFNAKKLVVTLFSGTVGGSHTSLGQLVSTGTVGAFSAAGLAAGSYYFLVTATYAKHALAATYAFGAKAILSSTPIPPALLMFVTALGGLGFVGYRRRASSL